MESMEVKELRDEMDARFEELRAEMDMGFAEVRKEIAELKLLIIKHLKKQ